MARSVASLLVNKNNAKGNTISKGKGKGKTRSTIADELFRSNGRLAGPSGNKRPPLGLKSSVLNRAISRFPTKQRAIPVFHKPRGRENEDADGEFEVTTKQTRHLGRYELEEEDEDMTKSCSDPNESDDEEEEDWLDGTTLIAPYQDEASETEEDRALALVECLQVPLQEKSHALKQDLCNAIITTINEIRQHQEKIAHDVDADRGKGIVHFNDACDKRHVDASRIHAQLKDSMAENQVAIKKLFTLLKEAYDRRNQLWVDLKARIDEITDQQAALLDQLDDNMASTMAGLEKKYKAMLKDDPGKDKEKLLRGVLGKL